ncbi:complex I 24 kDa subunit family protein [Sphaerobacter thermophilus]|uniref:complex I 24 kDa subunit family protein n=1 Tax=Sphaerobacter thermophilus TaxID=2057 RepID=UPI000DB3B710|nr:MAG: NAD(P)H-dependent oxidoreductase subunit E [Sphaerobacter thermophilus]
MAHATHTDGELDLEPLKRILERDFRYDTHQDAEELILGACQEAQNLYGWVPQPAAQVIADHLGVSVNRVYSLLTFYADFRTEPPGKHFLLLCHGTACYVMGSQRLIDTLRDEYGITNGEVTRDGELTLQVVNGCLGVCDLAPVIQVDHHTYCGRLTPDRLRETLEALKRGEPLEERNETD